MPEIYAAIVCAQVRNQGSPFFINIHLRQAKPGFTVLSSDLDPDLYYP